MQSSGLDRITRHLDPLLGLSAWDVRLGHGSFVTAEFGDAGPPRGRRGWRRGEWHLWIQHAAWRLEQGARLLAASEDGRDALAAALTRLAGRTLVAVSITPPTFDLALTFDGDLVLRTFAMHSAEYESWELFLPDGDVLTAGPGARWSIGPADVP